MNAPSRETTRQASRTTDVVRPVTKCRSLDPGPRGPNLAGRNLRGRSLAESNLQGADFRDTDLRDVDLRGADLFGCRMHRTDLRGTVIEMTRIVEIRIPSDLDLEIVNQIRAFDFQVVSPRHVRHRPVVKLPCPYRDAALRPLLYEWGSKTWNGGRGWETPERLWTLEEIIAAVLTELGCRHDLPLPERAREVAPVTPTTVARPARVSPSPSSTVRRHAPGPHSNSTAPRRRDATSCLLGVSDRAYSEGGDE